MNLNIHKDLWQSIKDSNKNVLLYGMGNGADKIIHVCESYGIKINDIFASDGFVRGQLFHGKRVLSFSEVCTQYATDNTIVLLAFGTSRKEVLDCIQYVASNYPLRIPDVPVFGDTLFTMDFFYEHEKEFDEVYQLLSDTTSKELYKNIISYKLTGDMDYLMKATTERDDELQDLQPSKILSFADFGAYTGDTIKELLDIAPNCKTVFGFEPDVKNFAKLQKYANDENRAEIQIFNVGTWKENSTFSLDASGNRNASLTTSTSSILKERNQKLKQISVISADAILADKPIDYIKMDVEGAEWESIEGSKQTILRNYPILLISIYHRSEDLYRLPLKIAKDFPKYNTFHLFRNVGVPAWDIDFIAKV